jgi:hypothetical protein
VTAEAKIRPLPTHELVKMLKRVRKEKWPTRDAQDAFIEVLEQEIARRRREAS